MNCANSKHIPSSGQWNLAQYTVHLRSPPFLDREQSLSCSIEEEWKKKKEKKNDRVSLFGKAGNRGMSRARVAKSRAARAPMPATHDFPRVFEEQSAEKSSSKILRSSPRIPEQYTVYTTFWTVQSWWVGNAPPARRNGNISATLVPPSRNALEVNTVPFWRILKRL